MTERDTYQRMGAILGDVQFVIVAASKEDALHVLFHAQALANEQGVHFLRQASYLPIAGDPVLTQPFVERGRLLGYIELVP